MARLPAAVANAMITAVFPTATTFYLTLFPTTDPGISGASGEMAVTRAPINFAAPSGGTAVSGGANPTQIFTSVPAAPSGVGFFGIFSAVTAGTYECGGVVTGLAGSIPSGATITFAATQVTVGIA